MTSGAVVWITGLPSAGKSTFAALAVETLRERGVAAAVLDGDAVRASLVPAPGYDEAGRRSFYETLARLAALLATQGLVVLVPATANRRAFRERARELAPRYLEVLVDTPLAECAARDTKGLYAQSQSGEATQVPGAGAAYERPLTPDIVAGGGSDRSALEALLQRL
ncbi:MAG TPA: adenylyl-sulfate kinase [Polyangiaceae bacterium]|nr:adenylyl-sulfate kinase [Polyangiaceae bacterium]